MIKNKFRYLPKWFIMNPNEYKFYKHLLSFIDSKYSIVPQVHLDDLVKPVYTNKKDRLFSLRHINQKSVDFIVCNKYSMHPMFAIEIDGNSHKSEMSIERDTEVESILKEAGIPLLRLKNEYVSNSDKIKTAIKPYLG